MHVFRPEVTSVSKVGYLVLFPVLLLGLQGMATDSNLKMEGKEIRGSQPALIIIDIFNIQASENANPCFISYINPGLYLVLYHLMSKIQHMSIRNFKM